MSDASALLPDPEAVPLEDIPAVLGAVEAFRAQLWRRWTAPAASGSVKDRLLTAEEAAARTGMSVDWLYRHAGTLPFVRRPTRRAVRFSEAGLARWMATRGR